MAISKELQEIYSDYDNQEMYYDAIELSHPNFGFNQELHPEDDLYPSDTLYPGTIEYSTSVFMIQANEEKLFNVDGIERLFIPYPFAIVPPKVGADEQDIQVVFQNVSREIIEGIEWAAQMPEVPIKMRYFIFIDGEKDTQMTPITLTLGSVSADLKQISATAQRADLYKYFAPTKKYDNRFWGLIV